MTERKRIPVWDVRIVTRGGHYTVLVFTTYESARLMAKAYGPAMCPEVTGPHYHLVPEKP